MSAGSDRFKAEGQNMRVLAVNQFYLPDHSATSQLLGELCEDLARAGDEVHVLASRGSYLGGGRLAKRELRQGVRVTRPWATSWGKSTRAARMSDYLTFWSTSVSRAAVQARPDVLLVLTTPPMIAFGGALVSLARGIPLVTWVQDVYPDVAAEFGVIARGGRVFSALNRVAVATHSASTRIVALSDGMAQRLVAQGAARDCIRVIPNWADSTLVTPVDRAVNRFRQRHDLCGRFVVMYSGNLGEGHDFDTFIASARLLAQTHANILFLFVGEGSRRAAAERAAQGMNNVRFLGYQPRAELAESLSAADVHLVSLRLGLEGLLVPSKLYGALASGRPICRSAPRRVRWQGWCGPRAWMGGGPG
ncbi:MAG: glycosyltransferase family 4 protein [Myxococcales bacterium]|nr:glycosyltransferase family 4 protein [Myxococcales bacterium]